LLWLFLEMGVSWTIYAGWPWTWILLISASQAAKNIGINQQHSMIFFFFLNNTGVWSQALALANEVLFHLSHTLNSFGFSYFSGRVLCFLPRLDCTTILLPRSFYIASIIHMTHHAWPMHFFNYYWGWAFSVS
jgi:hypothetical protein